MSELTAHLGVTVGAPEPELLRLWVSVLAGGADQPAHAELGELGLAAVRVPADVGAKCLTSLNLITGGLLISGPAITVITSYRAALSVSSLHAVVEVHGAADGADLVPVDGWLGLGAGALPSPNVAPHVLGGRGEEAPVILVRLEDNDVELGSEVEGQGDVRW